MSNRETSIHCGLSKLLLWTVILAGHTALATAQDSNLAAVEALHEGAAVHAEQQTFYDLVAEGRRHEAFVLAFEEGDELFEAVFNVLDGAGANVGQNQRFTRFPRADLFGGNEWANHFPLRETGPNAQACNACHNLPFDDGAGRTSSNVHRDPLHTADPASFITRNTPSVFAVGALQRLAEEMTERLHATRDQMQAQACARGGTVIRELRANGVSFGRLAISRRQQDPCEVDINTSAVAGIDADLVVKPFQWKGSKPTVRVFNREAAHNELGMQPVELVGDGVDGDFDGQVDEMTVGDQTALAIYLAAQPRPTSKLELNRLGLLAQPLTRKEIAQIRRGRQEFAGAGCTDCHKPALKITAPIYSEPSQNPHYRDNVFPGGQDPLTELVDPGFAISFDLTQDQPDNIIKQPDGTEYRLGSFQTDRQGRAIVRLFGDLQRHEMGPELAEPIDQEGIGESVWMTKELWGVGSTAPYLHDGRATTLAGAILAHGGEAAHSREAFAALEQDRQVAIIAFLDNLVLFKIEEE